MPGSEPFGKWLVHEVELSWRRLVFLKKRPPKCPLTPSAVWRLSRRTIYDQNAPTRHQTCDHLDLGLPTLPGGNVFCLWPSEWYFCNSSPLGVRWNVTSFFILTVKLPLHYIQVHFSIFSVGSCNSLGMASWGFLAPPAFLGYIPKEWALLSPCKPGPLMQILLQPCILKEAQNRP